MFRLCQCGEIRQRPRHIGCDLAGDLIALLLDLLAFEHPNHGLCVSRAIAHDFPNILWRRIDDSSHRGFRNIRAFDVFDLNDDVALIQPIAELVLRRRHRRERNYQGQERHGPYKFSFHSDLNFP